MDTEQNMKQNSEFSQELCCREAKNIISARFYAYFQILRRLSDSAKNSAGTESQNPGETAASLITVFLNGNIYILHVFRVRPELTIWQQIRT